MKFRGLWIFFICIGHFFLPAGCNSVPVNPPQIDDISPTTSRIDTVITIYGANFGEDAINNRVTVNGYVCPVLSATPTLIKIKAVPGISSGPVTVKVNQLGSISHQDFRLISHVIDTLLPHSGKVGETLFFKGRYFCENSDSVIITLDRDSLSHHFTVYDYQRKGDSVKFSAKIPVGVDTTKQPPRISIRIGAITIYDKYDFEVVK